jgi:FkbM family methyltransferase
MIGALPPYLDAGTLRRRPYPSLSLLGRASALRQTFANWILLSALRSFRIQWLPPRIAAALGNLPATAKVRNGPNINIRARDVGSPYEIFGCGEYDFAVIPWEKVATVLDCGAHVGSFALWVSARCPCRVLAVEPGPGTYRLLERNTRHLDSISTLQRAVAGSAGVRTLYDAYQGDESSLFRPRHWLGEATTETITLASLMDVSGFEQVDLLKMDIEGAEWEVFETVPAMVLERIRCAVIELHTSDLEQLRSLARRWEEHGRQVAVERKYGCYLMVVWPKDAG